jgi:SPP1 gp7 family putative phage head morphogenesis protein
MMPDTLPLTAKKQKWSRNRKTVLRGTKLNYNVSQQEKYVKALNKLVYQMTRETQLKLKELFKKPFSKEFFAEQKEKAAMDDSIGSQARILMNALTKKFTALFNYRASSLAQTMIEGAFNTSKTTLHRSLEQLSGGLSLKTGVIPSGMEDVSKALIEENVSLIQSIPEKYFSDVTGSVMRSITTGRGLADLVPQLEKYEGITERRATNIALDQTRKAYNSINAQRLTSLGVKQFEWIHSYGGQKPRQSHIKLDGHIFSFENLYNEQAALGVPEADRGLPGQAINCRCTINPVIDLSGD